MNTKNRIYRFFTLFLKKRYWFFIILFLIPVWIFLITPFLLQISDDFTYQADMVSVDNFYDEKLGDYQWEQYSDTQFSYEVVEKNGPILTIKNTFHVQTSAGKTIFHTAPLYAINSITGQHVKGAGDRERSWYLFAPRWLNTTDTFSYWHVSNNQPVTMEYAWERFFFGLRLLKYESQNQEPLDQTEFMHHLPGIPEERGIKLNNRISLWIEPISGYLVKFEDRSEEYFYFDRQTGEKIVPYNQFLNVYTDESFRDHIEQAKDAKQKVIWIQIVVPSFLFLALVVLFLFYRFPGLFLFSREYTLPLLVFIGGLFVTFFAFNISLNNIEENEEHNFSIQAAEITQLIKERMDIYINVLLGWRWFFDASASVERDEWRSYTESLNIQTNYPGIQGFGFAKVISPQDKNDFIDSVRQEGFADFSITPAGSRDIYTSILFLEPFDERNQRAFGYDMFSEPVRRKAMVQARDSGNPTISQGVILKQETETNVQTGFLLYVPVYKKGSPIDKSERSKNIFWYVYSPFRVGDFIQWTVDIQKYDVAFQIFDGLRAATDSRIYNSSSTPSSEEQLETTFGARTTVYIAGRPWTLVFTNSPTFERNPIYIRLSYGVLILWFFINSLLFFALHSVTSSRKNAVLYAQKVNRKLIKNITELENTKQTVLNTLADVEIQKDKFSRANIRLKLATRSAKIGVWEWDILKNKLVWDSQMCTLYGIQKEDFSGKYETWQESIDPLDRERVSRAINNSIQRKHGLDIKFRVSWPDKSLHDIRAFGIVERNQAGEPLRMVWVNWDITHETIVDRQKTEFVSVASHQLRTPLTAVSWYTEMFLNGDTGKLTTTQKKYLREIYGSNKIMIDLVNKLLNVSRIELGTLKIESKKTDIIEIVEDIFREQGQSIRAKKLTIIKDFDTINPYMTDPTLVRMILQNLLDNSIKYTPVSGTISCSIRLQKNNLSIAVSDTGCGIPKSVQKEIFQKFFRAHNVRDINGTGLGLYIVKSVVEKLHWTMSFTSISSADRLTKKQHSGTTFTVTLPYKL
jgi:signal transduction histidine kinase/CHASE1-domain containing sensor protein